MARPIKTGLEYFSVDTEWDLKMKIFKAKYKLFGIGLITELWKAIYSEGYYYPWDEDSQILFANEHGLEIKQLSEMVDFAIERKIFDKRMYTKYQILTSPGIQKRYLNSCSKRSQVFLIKEYLLIKPEKSPGSPTEIVIESKTSDKGPETGVSVTETEVFGVSSTQSKESKESKERRGNRGFRNGYIAEWKNKLKRQKHGVISYPEEFEIWWKAYPNKAEKKRAFKCWLDCLEAKDATFEALLTAAENYRAACKKRGTAENYIKHPSTFLGPDEPWRDYVTARGSPSPESRKSSRTCPICDIEWFDRSTCAVCKLPVEDFTNPEAVAKHKERMKNEQAASR